MNNKKCLTIIIDFDSTFIQCETMDTLAELTVEDSDMRSQLMAEIKHYTDLAMTGEMGFEEALVTRLKLFAFDRDDVQRLIATLRHKITPSFQANRSFLHEHAADIYLISGGFCDVIRPIAAAFGIPGERVLANDLVYDQAGRVVGINSANPLAHDMGKVKIIRQLALPRPLVIIGDGYTDYEIRKYDLADRFYLFSENILRESMIQYADKVITNFDEFIDDYHKFKSNILN